MTPSAALSAAPHPGLATRPAGPGQCWLKAQAQVFTSHLLHLPVTSGSHPPPPARSERLQRYQPGPCGTSWAMLLLSGAPLRRGSAPSPVFGPRRPPGPLGPGQSPCCREGTSRLRLPCAVREPCSQVSRTPHSLNLDAVAGPDNREGRWAGNVTPAPSLILARVDPAGAGGQRAQLSWLTSPGSASRAVWRHLPAGASFLTGGPSGGQSLRGRAPRHPMAPVSSSVLVETLASQAARILGLCRVPLGTVPPAGLEREGAAASRKEGGLTRARDRGTGRVVLRGFRIGRAMGGLRRQWEGAEHPTWPCHLLRGDCIAESMAGFRMGSAARDAGGALESVRGEVERLQTPCLFRINALSLVYLLFLLLLPWFPGPSRHSIQGCPWGVPWPWAGPPSRRVPPPIPTLSQRRPCGPCALSGCGQPEVQVPRGSPAPPERVGSVHVRSACCGTSASPRPPHRQGNGVAGRTAVST
ncbi:hypothetical protein J1605_006906 [Eschrichtius robustus]|uniref:Uncharacterized protein n=1 Tax=Eschrichtius robustus TaxID=9764 RepID=A0AB34H4E8_ESCRO|nr:hypothetical protein J1605_006906 [Eschrichtius robustus]